MYNIRERKKEREGKRESEQKGRKKERIHIKLSMYDGWKNTI